MPDTRPRLAAPPGTCDTHFHIYEQQYKDAPTATSPSPRGPLSEYRKMAGRLGIQRFVVVQPSSYGDDHRCTLAAVGALGKNARGVAILKVDTPEAELKRLHAGGIRAWRCFFITPAGLLGWGDMPRVAERARAMGWSLIVQFRGDEMAERAPLLRKLDIDMTIDHLGRFPVPTLPDAAGVKALLGLLDTGRVYVKLSAPYESAHAKPPFAEVGALAKTFVKHAPERCLWASNWPHPGQNPRPDDAVLLDAMLDWAPDDRTRRMILVDNAARLYKF